MKTILLASLVLLSLGIGISQAQVSGTIYGPNGSISSYNGNCSGGTMYGPNGQITTWNGGWAEWQCHNLERECPRRHHLRPQRECKHMEW